MAKKKSDRKTNLVIIGAIIAFIVVAIFVVFIVKFDIVDECASPCEGTDHDTCLTVCVRRTYKKTLFEMITNK